MNRILLVDDEPTVVAALKRELRLGFGDRLHITSFNDPEQALLYARDHAVDIVVSDFRMPRLNGIEFLKRLKRFQPYPVRLILSASTEAETVLQAVNEVGVFQYITKPWDRARLVEVIESALVQARASHDERRLADEARVRQGALDSSAAERRRLEEMEPGITRVDWGPNGEVLIDLPIDDRS